MCKKALDYFFFLLADFLGIIYYDVWIYTSGQLENISSQWQTYLPTVFFSICAGLGTYYLMMTFGKFRMMAEKNQKHISENIHPKMM